MTLSDIPTEFRDRVAIVVNNPAANFVVGQPVHTDSRVAAR